MGTILSNIPSGKISKILEDNSGKISDLVFKFVKNEWEKFKINFECVYQEYYLSALDKYSKVKTLFSRTEPLPLYQFFEAPYIITHSANSEKLLMDSVERIESISKFIVIQGNGGIGKTTLMKHFFVDTIRIGKRIPVFIELRNINDSEIKYEIIDLVYKELNTQGSTIKKEYMDYALKSGCFTFLLDGYDEITSDRTKDFCKKLDEFCDKYPNNYYYLTSRPTSDFFDFRRFTVVDTCPFDLQQAKAFVNRIPYDKDVKERFLLRLNIDLFIKHKSFASNPLLLSIMLITFERYSDIPEKLHLFYEQAFETMFRTHDNSKGLFKRELRSSLDIDEFKKIFATFCFYTYIVEKLTFTEDELKKILNKCLADNQGIDVDGYIYDLCYAVCVIYKVGSTYIFTHRSFQEYFCALYLLDRPDNELAEMSVKLVERILKKEAQDVIMPMLRDMNKDRFNIAILVPVFDYIYGEYELDISKLSQLYKSLKLNTGINLDNNYCYFEYPADDNSTLIRFVMDYFDKDYLKYIQSKDKANRYCIWDEYILDDIATTRLQSFLKKHYGTFGEYTWILSLEQLAKEEFSIVLKENNTVRHRLSCYFSYKKYLLETSSNKTEFPDIKELLDI